MSINEMEIKVNERRELKRMQDELTAEITAIEDEIKQHMTATTKDEISGPTLRSPGSPSPVAASTARASRPKTPTSGSGTARQPLPGVSFSAHKESPLHQPAKTGCKRLSTNQHKGSGTDIVNTLSVTKNFHSVHYIGLLI